MGRNNSKPAVHLPLLDEEWRTVQWTGKAEPLPHNDEREEDQQIRILIYGPIGHGKSSLINTVDSVLQGRVTGRALVDDTAGTSFTKMYTTYKIPKREGGKFYPFVFNDIAGLEKDQGVCEEDIKLAMMGHVKDGYPFNPNCTLSTNDPFYNTNPSFSDKVHVLVCVVAASKLHLVDDDTMEKMRIVRLYARDMGIPQIAILTKVDEACPQVKGNLRNVYKSKYVKKQMEVLSASLGIPLNCIFPVKNYHSEINRNGDLEILILMALKQMLNFGEDFVNDYESK